MNRRLLLVLAIVVSGGAVACRGASGSAPQLGTAQSVRGNAVALTRNGAAVVLPYVPAGTSFDVRLDQAIDSRLSSPGDAISATTTQPIRSFNGDVLVPAGAKLEGRIGRISRVNGAQMTLDFDTLALPTGKVPLGVLVLAAEQTAYQTVPSGVTSMQKSEGQPEGGGPSAAPPGPSVIPQVSMSRGAMLKLELTTPVVDAHGLRSP
jgi:hypothetical protein